MLVTVTVHCEGGPTGQPSGQGDCPHRLTTEPFDPLPDRALSDAMNHVIVASGWTVRQLASTTGDKYVIWCPSCTNTILDKLSSEFADQLNDAIQNGTDSD